jgi:hypothetical protein
LVVGVVSGKLVKMQVEQEESGETRGSGWGEGVGVFYLQKV